MKTRVHQLAVVLFALSFLYDIVVWGGVYALGDVGTGIADSASREAPLAATYIAVGNLIDSHVPALRDFGAARLSDAFSDGFDRIRADSTVAMDLIFGTSWNAAHIWIKTMYWAAPILLLLALVTWARRPKQVRSLRR
jgi:hypothetical protein